VKFTNKFKVDILWCLFGFHFDCGIFCARYGPSRDAIFDLSL